MSSTSKNTSSKKVFVGLSGGVDSAVSAALLKEQGYDVTGVFIKVWTPEHVPCTWREERRDAMRVAARLGIPFLFFDFSDEYKRGVADYMIEEYKRGRTPNPDVLCNREIKFGAFWHKAKELGADYIATGHYLSGEKDQRYFLWMLTPEDYDHTLFPVGRMDKRKVRELAAKSDLPVSEKKDSQGICFIGEVTLEDFLKECIEAKPGNVLNTDGKVVGTHKGAIYYTLGERHGFEVSTKSPSDRPYYVVAKDMRSNTITVSNDEAEIRERSPKKIRTAKANWLTQPSHRDLSAQIRYRGEKLLAEIEDDTVTFAEPVRGLSPGQSIVFYQGEKMVGGAIIDAIIE